LGHSQRRTGLGAPVLFLPSQRTSGGRLVLEFKGSANAARQVIHDGWDFVELEKE
jgi:hypothetical protein